MKTYKINIIFWNSLSEREKKKCLLRPILTNKKNIKKHVKKILYNVKKYGDLALHKYSKKFDNCILKNFYIPEKDFEKNNDIQISPHLKCAISRAKRNIMKFHSNQLRISQEIETYPGVTCRRIFHPIKSVGLYVPKGKKPLISTVLMLSIPAKLAGCSDITLCTPPPIHPELLYTAFYCGINKILQLGGAHAIAALAFGTSSVRKVSKIFGPGNFFVTEAKRQINCMLPNVDIDMLAGPSEVLIISDHFSQADFIAADLLAQLEHDLYAHAILVTYSVVKAKEVIFSIEHQVKSFPQSMVSLVSLKNLRIIIVQDLYACFSISNFYCPEHLILHIKDFGKYLCYVKSAGSIFCGAWTPETAGDYITGANHVIPTYGCANIKSPLSVDDFQKSMVIQEMKKNSFLKLSDHIIELANAEGMNLHSNSIVVRKKKILL